jgi:hypothetical protein
MAISDYRLVGESVKMNPMVGGIGGNQDFFLNSSRRESRSSYQISSDNPQKDNFHNLIFVLTKDAFSVLLIQQS